MRFTSFAKLAGLVLLVPHVSADFHLGNLFLFGTLVDYEYFSNVAVPSNNYQCGGTTGQIISGQSGNTDTNWPASFTSSGSICGVNLVFEERAAGGYDLYDSTNTYQGWCVDNSSGNGFSCLTVAYYITYTEYYVCFTPICD
jgi:hypothetical protein